MNRLKFDRNDAISFTAWIFTLALTIALYARLPARIPVHFDLYGRPNGWSNRSFGAWLLPASALALWAFTQASPWLVSASGRGRLVRTPRSAVGACMTLIFSALQIVILYSALHRSVPIGRALLFVLGVAWMAIGQLFPQLRRNPFFGIRTPWTLASDETWARTHRFGAYLFVAAGAAALIAAIVGGAASAPLGMMALLGSALATIVYSYLRRAR